MGLVFLVAVLVTVSYLPSSTRAATCAATLCMANSICREILDRSTGVISARCLDPKFYPLSGHDQICTDGQPLWIVTNNRGYAEAACGRVVDRTTCPSGYTCVIAPNDAYSLCCPSFR
ncbi:uncharacterized protein LOC112567014 [Pomacea canaliculata]|uniref:uncharacterized protein LOC112567014 n=1 Tax=Pomacea canaliculata TaxID=400727 RepID=UPI000D739149|nr:uncharacterized protein LOC112567014 [Pomacea canaliculata]